MAKKIEAGQRSSRRAYRSTVRAAQSGATRSRIVASAERLFLADGFVRTTVADIAAEAGVATDTVYKSIGSKHAVLQLVMDVVIGGDERDLAVLERPGPVALRDEPDPEKQLAMLAVGVADQLARIVPMDDVLSQAAVVDERAAVLRADIQQRQRREAMRTIVGWVAARRPLKPGLSEAGATDLVWAMTSPELYRLLCESCGWNSDRYTSWLKDTLITGLLA